MSTITCTCSHEDMNTEHYTCTCVIHVHSTCVLCTYYTDNLLVLLIIIIIIIICVVKILAFVELDVYYYYTHLLINYTCTMSCVHLCWTSNKYTLHVTNNITFTMIVQ